MWPGQIRAEMARERLGIHQYLGSTSVRLCTSLTQPIHVKFYSISWADLLACSTGWRFPQLPHPNLQLYCHFSVPNVITPCYSAYILSCVRFDGVHGDDVRKRRRQRAGAWRQTLPSGPSIWSDM